jgi:DMSO/TMAO reductase YedYZ molybdopterin-dependent catalytic subunit
MGVRSPSPGNPAGQTRHDRGPVLAAAAAGAIAAGVALAVGELVAAAVLGAPSLVIAIGDLVIGLQPPGAKDLIVELFGTNDKFALNLLIVVATVAIAAVVGIAGRRRWRTAVAGFGLAGGAALFAVLREPLVSPVLAVPTVAVALGASLPVLRGLLAMTAPAWRPTGPVQRPVQVATMPDWDRRRFIIAGSSLAVGSIVLGSVGRAFIESRRGGPPASGTASKLGPPSATAPPLPTGAAFDVSGLTPVVVPNEAFYRIDTALLVPRVDVASWRLTIRGMVDREVALTYPELAALPQFEEYVTIACVSNRVGGDLVGNAKWTGAHLRDVLAMAGVRLGATQIVGRSVDGFTVGFPTEWAMDPSRDPMIALGMNGQPLPIEHGYPARLIVPGLYGYVSATKWLSEIELTTLEAFDAYWVPLGWAKEAPILTQSRIDVPKHDAQLAAGQLMVAGVAWAPDRGVSKVELKIDDGPWAEATLSAAISRATWVQWRFEWNAPAGSHRIEVRATDGAGTVQTDQVTPPGVITASTSRSAEAEPPAIRRSCPA